MGKTRSASSEGGLIVMLLKLGPKLLKFGGKLFSMAVKLFKGGTAVSAMVFTGTYALLFSWKFAVMLLVALFVHEYGHVWAMKRLGIPVRGFYFIPFMGAVAVPEKDFTSRYGEGIIAIMGPLWGSLLAMACILGYFFTHSVVLGASAAFMIFLNLFNLLPLHPLDGGRILKSIMLSSSKRWMRYAFLIVTAGVVAYVGFGLGYSLPVILFIVSLPEFSGMFANPPFISRDRVTGVIDPKLLEAWKKVIQVIGNIDEHETELMVADYVRISMTRAAKELQERILAIMENGLQTIASSGKEIDYYSRYRMFGVWSDDIVNKYHVRWNDRLWVRQMCESFAWQVIDTATATDANVEYDFEKWYARNLSGLDRTNSRLARRISSFCTVLAKANKVTSPLLVDKNDEREAAREAFMGKVQQLQDDLEAGQISLIEIAENQRIKDVLFYFAVPWQFEKLTRKIKNHEKAWTSRPAMTGSQSAFVFLVTVGLIVALFLGAYTLGHLEITKDLLGVFE